MKLERGSKEKSVWTVFDRYSERRELASDNNKEELHAI